MNFKKNIEIYLSGSIDRKGDQHYPYWTIKEEKLLSDLFHSYSVECTILNPNNSAYQRETDEIYKSELNFIKRCSLVLVELSLRRGIGVGVEMYHAKLNNVPVFSIAPNNSYYRNDDWIHPFIKNLSTIIVEDIGGLIQYLNDKSVINTLIKKRVFTKKI